MEELVKAFSLERVIKSGARFNPEKAKWYNKEYLRMKSDAELTDLFIPVLEGHGIQVVSCPKCALTAGAEVTVQGADFKNRIFTRDYVQKVVTLIKERATFVADFWDIASYLFVSPQTYAEKDAAKFWKEENYTLAFQVAEFIENFDGENGPAGVEFTKEQIEGPMEEFIRSHEWPMGKVMNCLRLALVGASSGLGIADIVSLIGKAELAVRIENIRKALS